MFKAEWTNKDSLDLQPTCNKLATDAVMESGRSKLMSNISRHPDCEHRTELGNCLPIGGCCTAVPTSACEAERNKSMNKEEIITVLQDIREYLCAGNPVWDTSVVREAMTKAIEAVREQ